MKIVGMVVVGAGEADRFLNRTLDSLKGLVDDAIIVLNNADNKTVQMVRQTGWLSYNDNREWGKEQWKIKEAACRKMSVMEPDWVLCLDADEAFGQNLTRKELEKLCSGISVAYYFPFATFWDSERHINPAATIWNVRLWKYVKENGFLFEPKPLHCGLAPRWAYHTADYAPFIVKHWGLMDRDNRIRKSQRYKVYDPNAVYKDNSYYEMLTSEAVIVPFNEESFQQEVSKEVAKTKVKGDKTPKKPPMQSNFDCTLVIRDDSSVVTIPNKHLEETLRRHKTWRIMQQSIISRREEAPLEEPKREDIEAPKFTCDVCGYEGKSDRSVKVHKGLAHKTV
jgi:hypothetical protein